jgi:uroporphyrin-III C-methyltransferase/precorrin-2 dehydrogenase/sirohydrochlorin ferrochelatase/uroporphyrin-III C-methyltransferase
MQNEALDLDRASPCDSEQTLVIYMGLGQIGETVHQLVAAGHSPETPAAIVEQGSTVRQRRIVTTLGDLPKAVRRDRIQAPALLIIGAVVALAAELEWFVPFVHQAELRYA